MRRLTRFANVRSPLLLLVASTAFVWGCGTRVSFTPTNTPPRAMTPRSPDSVQIFTTQSPDRPYVEVGVIEAQQASAYSTADETEVVAKLRESAAKQGCDALIITGSADKVVGSGYTSNGSGTSSVTTLRGFRGTCILFKDATAATTNAGAGSGVDAGSSAGTGPLAAAPPSPAANASAAAPTPAAPTRDRPAATTNLARTAAPSSTSAAAPAAAAFSCTPGTTQQCVGPAGCKGGQACNDQGSGYTTCDCGRSR